jgi:hypothetical protein
MNMKRFWILALAASCIPTLHAATGCVMIGNGEARILAQGEEQTLPTRLADCDGAKVLAGSVSACFVNEKSQRTCRTLKADESFDAVALAARPGAGTGAFRATLMSLLKGDPHARIGQTRHDPPYLGFPYANVLLPEGDMLIRLRTPKTKKVKTFTLNALGSTATALVVTPVDGRLIIPASAFLRGMDYSWVAHGDAFRFSGRFKMASADDAALMAKAATVLTADASLDDISRRVLLAEIYFENGFAFDADGLIGSLVAGQPH